MTQTPHRTPPGHAAWSAGRAGSCTTTPARRFPRAAVRATPGRAACACAALWHHDVEGEGGDGRRAGTVPRPPLPVSGRLASAYPRLSDGGRAPAGATRL